MHGTGVGRCKREGLLICRPEDRRICEKVLRTVGKGPEGAAPFGDLIVAVGRYFLDVPYEADTLESEGPEELVVNLRAFDCVTLVENAVVLAGMIRAGKTAFADYAAALERIRYRRGRCDGYPSRLHYFTDWLHDGKRKGMIRDVTAEIGGLPYPRDLCGLTDRRSDHPPLSDAAVFRRMRTIEGMVSRRPLHHIPKSALAKALNLVQDGDLIAITTHETGFDVGHAGIAVRTGNAVRLLHASSAAGRVVLSEETLGRYLAAKPSRTGIIVGRAIPPDRRGGRPVASPPHKGWW